MAEMIAYTRELLLCIAEFLGTAPIIYLFGCIVACFVVKVLLSLLNL